MAIIESSRTTAPAPTGQSFPGRHGDMVPLVQDEHQVEEQEGEEREEESPLLKEPEYGTDKERLLAWIDDINLARYLDYQTLGTIGQIIKREYEIDEQSRSEWKDDAEKALKFTKQKSEAKQYPWPGAASFVYPLITTAAFQFSAVAYPALVGDANIVKGKVWGEDTGTPATKDGKPNGAPLIDAQGNPVWLIAPGEKQVRATKIGEHMSWQFISEMPEWDTQTDQGLIQMPVLGGFVRKTFRDETKDCNCSLLVSLLDLVWNQKAPSFERASRHTEVYELYPHEITEKERNDAEFLPLVYPSSEPSEDGASDPNDSAAPHVFLEQHRRYDLDGDGYAEPLIFTVHKMTGRVVRIIARFDKDGIHENDDEQIMRVDPVEHYTLYRFLPDPEGGSYPVGFGHLLKALNEGINTTVNQMFDAGHLQIAGGGFVGTSLSIHSGPVNFQLGEYKPVNNKGQSIRDAVFPIPFPGPSQVLFQLLGFLVSAAKEVASIQNILAGDTSLSNVQPTTLLALIEQGMRLYTAIYKRVWRSMKEEFDKLYRLNRIYITEDARYQKGDTWRTITPHDYRLGGGVEPLADPNLVTDMQKMSRALVVFMLKDDPFCDPIEIRRRLLEAARVEKIDKILKTAPPPPPPQAQMEIALGQSQLGRQRAAEQKDATQAILNLALARKADSGTNIAWYEQQIDAIRTHLEALNTTIKAADVDAKFYGHNVRMKQTGDDARDAAGRAKQASQAGPPAPAQPPQPAIAPPAPPTAPTVAPASPAISALPAMNGAGP